MPQAHPQSPVIPASASKRESSRFYAPDYRRQLRDAGAFRALSPSAHVVLAALCDRANAAGVAWPAVDTIAEEYGLGASTVRRALGELTAAGLVLVLRRAGKQNRYHLTAPAAPSESGDRPAQSERPPSQIERPPLSNREVNMTMDHFTDHNQDQQQGDASPDVVASATPPREETPAIADSEGEAIQLLSEELRAELKALGLHPGRVNRYGEDRVRWVLGALETERKRKQIVNPAGWVVQALKDNWALPPNVVQHALPFAAVAADAHRPPEATRWARSRETGKVFEVTEVSQERVKFIGGFNAPVVPAHQWDKWEWFEEYPGVETSAAEDEAGLLTEAELDPGKGKELARIAAWVAIKRPDERALNDKLQACGLTFEDWEAFQAVQALAQRLQEELDA